MREREREREREKCRGMKRKSGWSLHFIHRCSCANSFSFGTRSLFLEGIYSVWSLSDPACCSYLHFLGFYTPNSPPWPSLTRTAFPHFLFLAILKISYFTFWYIIYIYIYQFISSVFSRWNNNQCNCNLYKVEKGMKKKQRNLLVVFTI